MWDMSTGESENSIQYIVFIVHAPSGYWNSDMRVIQIRGAYIIQILYAATEKELRSVL